MPPFQMEQFLEPILEHFRDGIYITDGEANTVYMNHRYEQISGLSQAEMLGRNMRELVECGVISISGTLQVLESGEPVSIEQTFRTGRRAMIDCFPVFDRGEGATGGSLERVLAEVTGSVSSSADGRDLEHAPDGAPDTAEGSDSAGTFDEMAEGAVGDRIVLVITIVREITEIHAMKKELQALREENRRLRAELEQRKEMKEGGNFVALVQIPENGVSLRERSAEFEAAYLEAAYRKCGNVREAAHLLAVDASTFTRKRQKYKEMGLL